MRWNKELLTYLHARKIVLCVSNIVWVDKLNGIQISCVKCTVDLVGQGRLTTILITDISISVIGSAIDRWSFFCSPRFLWVDKFNEIKISFVTLGEDF